MNYISLNGYKSTLIKGLLISELPPIVKPMQRASIEEIDGRDGDIITKLGYSAYDKKMTIGCYGDFNIDDIIQYFDSEGQVVFSNEPDKYYNYQILSQIDFERLCRFKTATVTFHVQPFKFSSVDNVMDHQDLSGGGSVKAKNNGNVISRPAIRVYGSGTVTVGVHDTTFSVTFEQGDTYITLDGTTLNATADSGALRNRNVSGNMKDLWLPVGESDIDFSSGVTRLTIIDGSRWI